MPQVYEKYGEDDGGALTPEAIMAAAINCDAPAYTVDDIRNISKVDRPCWFASIPKAVPIGM